jgi:putative tryptophan/tyrosine transport system substrate-binding protein
VRRREFIVGMGSAAAWSVAAGAQQPGLPVIGFLNATELDYRVAAFRRGLKEIGYVEDQNVVIDYRWAEGRFDRLPAMAADLVGRKVAVLAATGGANVALAAKAATDAIPIVFLVGADPVASGLVSSLSRPNGNLTGVSILATALLAKQAEMLHEAVPDAGVFGFLSNPDPSNRGEIGELQAAVDALGLKLVVVQASSDGEFEDVFSFAMQNRVQALIVSANALFTNRRHHLVSLAAARSIPVIYSNREYVAAGGLMSYGTSLAEGYRLVGTYTGRILKGEKPADLPVQLATKVELTINLKTARAFGITFPPTLLARADEVIE